MHSRGAGLASYIPESARAVTAHGRQFGLFGRIPSYPLYPTRVPSQFRTVLHLWLFVIPYAQRAICRAGRDQVARGIPGDGADSVKRQGGERVLVKGGRTVDIRTCASLGLERQDRGRFGL